MGNKEIHSPLSEAELLELIREAESRFSPQERRLWELIRINPAKWDGGDYGKGTGGFWVVGILGDQVLWYNEIEEGFNTSHFKKFGHIDELWCNQDELNWVIGRLTRFLGDGTPV